MKKACSLVCAIALLAGCFLAGGCVSPSYYAHVSYHHLKLIHDRESVDDLINAPATSPELKDRLVLSGEIRTFASDVLYLPDNGSYTTYTDLKRPYLMWNVVATPELSLAPVTWHFLFAGRLSYRGFYTREKADAFAAHLGAKGYDVHVAKVPAYSTLGWFDDPLLSSFIFWPEAELAALIFHELAHQKLYISDDTEFNESFAEMVAGEGLNRWFESKNDPAALDRYASDRRLYRRFIDLLMETAEALRTTYNGPLSEDGKRRRKEAIFSDLRLRFAELKTADPSYARFDNWFSSDLNNARFALLSTYHRFVPAFQNLLSQCNGDLEAFYAKAAALGELPEKTRKKELTRLLPSPDSPEANENRIHSLTIQ